MHWSRAALCLLAPVVLFGLGACEGASGVVDPEAEAQRTVVRVAEVGTGPVERLERSVGRVETFSSPAVAAEVAGPIVSVLADVGDQVEQGDVLAVVEREPFELRLGAATAKRQRLEVERERQLRELRRMETVAPQGFVSDADIDASRLEFESIDAELESVRYEEQQAQTDLKRTEIVSPVSGEVDSRAVSEGDFVSVGDTAFTVSPLTAYRVSLSFPQSLRGVLKRGQEVRLSAPDEPGAQALGEIARIRPSVDGGSRSLVAVVEFDDPGGWLPGMMVTGDVVVESRDDAVRIPRLSVVQRPAGNVVYVLDGDEVRQREIEMGHQTDAWVEVQSGLQTGEAIVTDGAQFLTDGAPVTVLSEDS